MANSARALALSTSFTLAACASSTPLFDAAHRGDPARVRSLLEENAEPDEASGGAGWTPLMIAAAEGHPEVVSVLLEAGANANARNAAGRTALMFASQYGFLEIVGVLIGAGADVNAVPTAEPRWPALLVASQNGHFEVVRLLVESGANTGYRDRNDTTAIELAFGSGELELADFLIESWPGPLYRACLPIETARQTSRGKQDPKLVAHFLCRVRARSCKEDPEGEPCRNTLAELGMPLPPIDTLAPW